MRGAVAASRISRIRSYNAFSIVGLYPTDAARTSQIVAGGHISIGHFSIEMFQLKIEIRRVSTVKFSTELTNSHQI